MPLQRMNTPVILSISDSIPKIFDQVQVSIANHTKNYVALNKLHKAAANVTEPVKNGIAIELIGEKQFEDLFLCMLYRILPVKRGIPAVERIVKFVAGYVEFINEKGDNRKDGDVDDDEETLGFRFTLRILRTLLKGFDAKDKYIRFRVLQVVAEIIGSIDGLEESMHKALHEALVKRAYDKEASIRAQTIISLLRILHMTASGDRQEETIEIVLDCLVHDPSSEVRKAALLNIPLTQVTLPLILSRTRDVDPSIRKSVFVPVLLEQLENPRQLSIAQRERLATTGLKDRDQTVRSAAVKLFASWVDTLEGDILEFIRLFDFDLLGNEDNPAKLALVALFESRTDIMSNLDFGDAFWENLVPEKAFLARIFVEHCIQTKDEARMESSMPVVTAFAFRIQSLYNELLNNVSGDMESNFFGAEGTIDVDKEEYISNSQFILGELMKLVVNMDYGDEIGRRKMFALVRDMVSQATLPEFLVPLCLDILRKLSSSERDLIRIVVEIIHELRDSEADDDDTRAKSTSVEETPAPGRTPFRSRKPTSEMRPEERVRADAIDLRCLALCIGMLERVNSSFEENSTLEGVLGELIIPAVKRKELPLRERGLVSLGLCCLIARRMALNSFQLFLQQVQQSPETLRLHIVQILFDIMMVHEGDFLGNASLGGDRVVEFFIRLLENESSTEIQAVLCEGLAKFLLSGMIADEEVLMSLVITYMSPRMNDNQGVRQCLSYFLPLYCYSSFSNQQRMKQIFMPVFEKLSNMYNNLDEDEEMISLLTAGSLLVDWTDPQKLMDNHGQNTNKGIHLDLAILIIKALFNNDIPRDDRKPLCQLLPKLYLPIEADDDTIRSVKVLLRNAITRHPLRDATSNNALARFDSFISKKYENQLSALSEEELRQLENHKDLFDFLDKIIPLDDEELVKMRTARKRRSESVTSSVTGADEDDYNGLPDLKPKPKGKVKAKRRRISRSDEESEIDVDKYVPMRSLPKRAVRAKAQPAITTIEITDSENESEPPITSASDAQSSYSKIDDNDDVTITAKPRSQKKRNLSLGLSEVSNGQIAEERDVSIMDTSAVAEDAEGDDSEVDDLLGDL